MSKKVGEKMSQWGGGAQGPLVPTQLPGIERNYDPQIALVSAIILYPGKLIYTICKCFASGNFNACRYTTISCALFLPYLPVFFTTPYIYTFCQNYSFGYKSIQHSQCICLICRKSGADILGLFFTI